MRLLHVLGSILLILFFCCSDSLAQTSCNDVSFDGHTYNAVKLGNQCWFSQNLRTTVYADGTSIPEVTNTSEWANLPTAQTSETYSAAEMDAWPAHHRMDYQCWSGDCGLLNLPGASESKYVFNNTNPISETDRSGGLTFTCDWASSVHLGARFIAKVDGTWYGSEQIGMTTGSHGSAQNGSVTTWVTNETYDVEQGNWYASLTGHPTGNYAWRDNVQWNSSALSGLPAGEIEAYGFAWLSTSNTMYHAIKDFEVIGTGPKDAQCAYDNNTSNISVYGRLYNWHAATNPAGLCPAGWRVPSSSDWITLMTHLDEEGFNGIEGNALKSTTTWNGGGGTNELGFSGVAGGVRSNAGQFHSQGDVSRHKSTNSAGTEVSYSYKLTSSSTELLIGTNCSYNAGTAVRCMQDAVSGCTDNGACNYNSAANTDDGNCTYASMWYLDADGDNLGDASNSQSACSQPAGYVADSSDNCDDTSACNYDGSGGSNSACDYISASMDDITIELDASGSASLGDDDYSSEPNLSGLIGHWRFETGSETEDETGNWGNLNLNGAVISNGKLDLDAGSYVYTDVYTGDVIGEKTLVTWVEIQNLGIRTGSPLGIQATNTDRFDAVVYAERQTQRFMAGSSNFGRTSDFSPGFTETQTNTLVCVAITYAEENGSVRVTGYRNGTQIGTYVKGGLATWSSSDAEVMFGPRHVNPTSNQLYGDVDMLVEEARLYNRALSATEIAQLTAGASFSSACEVASVGFSTSNFGCDDIGTPISNTVTVTDVNGNQASDAFTVTVVDNVDPVAAAQNITIGLDMNGAASITTGDIDSGSSDACGIESLSLSKTSFSCADVGANTVTLTVVDNNGNSSSADAIVTVQDNINPTALAHDLSVQLDIGGSVSITTGDVDNGSYDNCSIASMTLSQYEFSCDDVGNNDVTLTVTDSNGNLSDMHATVTVTVSDDMPPTAIAQNITVQLDAAGAVSITADEINNGSSDNCGIASMELNVYSFSCDDLGDNTITLTVTDGGANSQTVNATVVVQDNMNPFAVAQDITIELDENGMASITPEQINNGSNDNCSITGMSLSKSEFTCAEMGENTVTLEVTDSSGNTHSADATVTVVDIISPTATAQNLTVQLDQDGQASIQASDADNGSYDNCAINSMTLSQTAFTCADIGVHTLTLTVTDGSENENSTTLQVTVLSAITIADASVETTATQLESSDGEVNVTLGMGTAQHIQLTGLNGAPDYHYLMPAPLTGIAPGYYSITATDQNGCTSPANVLFLQYDLCCACGVNDIDTDGICDDEDNCTDRSAPNYNDPDNAPCN